jgi:tetratricopeptide (TPR) repeat protein
VTVTLSQLLEKNAENFTLLNYQRDLLMRIGDHDGVFRTSERMAVQSLNPDQVMRESCERLLQANPAHLLSLRWLTDHAHRTGDWAHAVELFEALMKVAPETAEDLEQLQRYFEALAGIQDLERGVEVARRLLDRHHREVENLKILARLYQQHGQLDEARRCFLCAREVDNQDRELHDAIATLDEEIRQDRIHEIEMLLEKEPENTALHHELGDLFYSFKRYTEAIPHLQRAEADPAIANLCRAKIAHALALRGMLDLAHETLAEVKLQAQSPEQLETLKAIHFNVGEIFREAGQSERALDAFKRLFRVDAGYRNVVQKLEKLTR